MGLDASKTESSTRTAGTSEPAVSTVVPSDWLDSEKWAWEQLREGRIADFTARYGELLPSAPEGWTVERELRLRFLEMLLLHDPFRTALPRQGLRLVGAWLREPFALDNARLAHQCRVEHSRIEALVSLSRIRSSEDISFRGSTFLADVNMRGARVDGGLDLSQAQFDSTLDLHRLDVAADFMLNGARCKNVWLAGAKIGGTIEMLNVKCEKMLDMEGLNAHADLFMGQSKFQSVSLTGAAIGGQLSGSGSHCGDEFNMEGINVRGDVFLRSGCKFNTLEATGAVINGQLDLVIVLAMCAYRVSRLAPIC